MAEDEPTLKLALFAADVDCKVDTAGLTELIEEVA